MGARRDAPGGADGPALRGGGRREDQALTSASSRRPRRHAAQASMSGFEQAWMAPDAMVAIQASESQSKSPRQRQGVVLPQAGPPSVTLIDWTSVVDARLRDRVDEILAEERDRVEEELRHPGAAASAPELHLDRLGRFLHQAAPDPAGRLVSPRSVDVAGAEGLGFLWGRRSSANGRRPRGFLLGIPGVAVPERAPSSSKTSNEGHREYELALAGWEVSSPPPRILLRSTLPKLAAAFISSRCRRPGQGVIVRLAK